MKSLEANPPPLFKSTVKLLILVGQTFDYNIAGIEVAREKTALIESYQRAGGGVSRDSTRATIWGKAHNAEEVDSLSEQPSYLLNLSLISC